MNKTLNRRAFLQSCGGAVLTALTLSKLVWANQNEEVFVDEQGWEVKDLVCWAPFQAFLPEQTDPHPSNPSQGTDTGTLKAEDIIKGQPVTFPFWHGHGGRLHEFTVTAEHMTTLKGGNPVVIYLPTTVVGDHYHMVVIDPNRPA